MSAELPKAVELTPNELFLLNQIQFDSTEAQPGGWIAARSLAESLIERDGIPHIRLRWFTDPDLAFMHGKSRMEGFRRNAGSEKEMMEHPHFLPYLRYFLYGPNLPSEVISGFCRTADEAGTSGMQLDNLCRFARSTIRSRGLGKDKAADEFHKLALECGLGNSMAEGIRKAAKQTR